MNLKTIDSMILKEFRAKSEPIKWIRYGVRDDKIAVVGMYTAYMIDKDKFPFDIEKLNKPCEPVTNFDIFKPSENHSAAVRSDRERVQTSEHTKKLVRLVRIQNAKTHAWIDTEYLKPFNSDCMFLIAGPKALVYVIEADEIVGVICPYMVKGE